MEKKVVKLKNGEEVKIALLKKPRKVWYIFVRTEGLRGEPYARDIVYEILSGFYIGTTTKDIFGANCVVARQDLDNKNPVLYLFHKEGFLTRKKAKEVLNKINREEYVFMDKKVGTPHLVVTKEPHYMPDMIYRDC